MDENLEFLVIFILSRICVVQKTCDEAQIIVFNRGGKVIVNFFFEILITRLKNMVGKNQGWTFGLGPRFCSILFCLWRF